MKFLSSLILLSTMTATLSAWSQNVSVDVTLNPAGGFKAQTQEVKGSAYKTKEGGVVAENILVDLRNIKTGITLRDTHFKKRLLVDQFPTAKLIKATGQNGQGAGEIEVKGMKLNVSGTYKIEGNNLLAQFKVHLPDLKIEDVKYMGVGVDDDVNVTVNVPLSSAPAAAVPAAKAALAPAPAKKK